MTPIVGERRATATKAALSYTDKNTADTVKGYEGNPKDLGIVRTMVPIGGLVLDVLLRSSPFDVLAADCR